MQDRFKFRFWHKPTNKMLDCYGFNEHCTFANTLDGIGTEYNPCATKDCELMQCTGLKDKNGKLIYQGDILGDIYNGLYIHYCEHCHQFQLYSQGYGCMACNGDIHWIEVVEDNKKLEVIGNIYENPKLLEVEQ